MKLLALLLAVSVTTNAGLVAAFISKPALAPPGLRDVFRSKSAADADDARAAAANRPARRNPTAGAPSNAWAGLASGELPALVARLRAAGFPATMIRAIVSAELQHRFSSRTEELRRTINETPYWRGEPGYFPGGSKIYEQINQLSRERSRALRDLLGQDAFAYAGMDPSEAQRRQYGNLSAGKIELVQRISDDYADMTSQLRAGMQGITLPEDREKFALLDREKRADLAAILTPEELADYEMRTSPVTSRLRTALTIMDASEAEFRSIYGAHVPHTDVLYPTSAGGMVFISDTNDARRAATQKINEDLKAALGPDRFANYQRATDRDFQQLYQLTRADNVSYDTLVRAFDTRQTTADASIKIVDDPQMTPEAKRAALKTLAQQARTQLLSTLGPASGPAYADTSRWLTGLDQGRAFSITPDGNISSRFVPPPRPASTTATPPKK